jgi:ATP-dependent Clp protease ATP-binding subunit ClpX
LTTLKHQICDFCGKGKDDVEKLVVGQNGAICNECVTLCDKILKEQTGQDNNKDLDKFNPVKVKDYLDEFIIGISLFKTLNTSDNKTLDNI